MDGTCLRNYRDQGLVISYKVVAILQTGRTDLSTGTDPLGCQ